MGPCLCSEKDLRTGIGREDERGGVIDDGGGGGPCRNVGARLWVF